MTSNKIFDALLVLQYQSGDKKALAILVKRHHNRFCSHAYWYLRDMDASKDVVQDSWTIIINKLEQLRDPNSFLSWAMRIITRKSMDLMRQNNGRRERLKRIGQTNLEETRDEERRTEIDKLKHAIKTLPKNQQIVLRLFYTQEYSLKEIGEILNVSVGTVKSRLFHAREKLKTILKHKS